MNKLPQLIDQYLQSHFSSVFMTTKHQMVNRIWKNIAFWKSMDPKFVDFLHKVKMKNATSYLHSFQINIKWIISSSNHRNWKPYHFQSISGH